LKLVKNIEGDFCHKTDYFLVEFLNNVISLNLSWNFCFVVIRKFSRTSFVGLTVVAN